MTPQEARTLIDYGYWAHKRVLAAVEAIPSEQFTRSMGNSFGSIRDTLVHMLWAETIWLSRWRGVSPTALPAMDAFPSVASLRAAWTDQESLMREFFSNIDEGRLQEAIAYKGLNGQPFETPLYQMLQHVVNHGTYHRGQVTTMLRQLEAAPPKGMDLIFYYREKA